MQINFWCICGKEADLAFWFLSHLLSKPWIFFLMFFKHVENLFKQASWSSSITSSRKNKQKKTPNPIEYSYSHNVYKVITTKYFPKGNLSIIKKELGENSKAVIHISSVQFSRSVVSNSLRTHESQHARPPCPSPTPGVYSDTCLSSWWCHPAISSSAPNPSQHQGLLQWVNSLHEVAKVLEF